jgi:hypothetical protein
MARGAYVRLLGEDPALVRVLKAVEGYVELSFATHRVQQITRAEIVRRIDICESIFEKLRGDLGWGIARILDRMPDYLKAELDGVAWTPDERACWMPGDG